jgi:hypothetical protein
MHENHGLADKLMKLDARSVRSVRSSGGDNLEFRIVQRLKSANNRVRLEANIRN